MGFVDTLMSGRYSSTDLAAIALGSGIWLPLFLASQGLLMATTPIVAHLVGGGREEQTKTSLHLGMVIAGVLSLISIILLHNSLPLLNLMGVTEELADLTARYLQAISWGFPAVLLYQLIRSYIEGFGKTSPAMKIAILGLACNIPLNYVLIYGKFGLPEMGGEGCGWATALVMWIMCITGILYLTKSPTFRSIKPFCNWKLAPADEFKQFLKLGTPIGIALLIEVSMFSVIALLLADLGEVMIAAHQITISFTGLIFMLPLSISLALTIRVGHSLGAQNFTAAKYTAFTGLMITLTLALFSSGLMALLAVPIASLYTESEQIIQIASTLLIVAALFQFSDAIQITCSGVLRGYKDTAIPLLLVFIAYWLVGLPAGYLLGKTELITEPMGPLGFWIGLLIGLTIGAILLFTRLLWRSRNPEPSH